MKHANIKLPCLLIISALLAPTTLFAQDAAAPANPLQQKIGPMDVTFTLDGLLQASSGINGFWGLADTFAPAANFPDEHYWMESYLQPGVTAVYPANERLTLRGGLSVIASGTLSDDYFMAGTSGRVLLEDAYFGANWKGDEITLDFSAGMQPYTVGHLLVLGMGAVNGFERGAATTAPRNSWEFASVAGISSDHWSLEAFYLDANELQSSDTGTQILGAKAEWKPNKDLSAGFAFFKVIDSTSPYPQAPVTLIPDGRDGLETYDLFWKWAPEQGSLAGFSFLGEVAIQRQSDINQHAWGGGLEIGYRWADAPFSPRLSYSPRYFSGDDPSTPGKLERFDPLFYSSSPATWSSGSNSSFAFYNSNVISHRLRLELVLSPTDYLNFNYWFNQAAETGSPLQFGQGARVVDINGNPAIITGVNERSLSHDIWLEHTHIFNQNWFLTSGVALSIPASGIKGVTNDPKNWWGALLNITFKY